MCGSSAYGVVWVRGVACAVLAVAVCTPVLGTQEEEADTSNTRVCPPSLPLDTSSPTLPVSHSSPLLFPLLPPPLSPPPLIPPASSSSPASRAKPWWATRYQALYLPNIGYPDGSIGFLQVCVRVCFWGGRVCVY